MNAPLLSTTPDSALDPAAPPRRPPLREAIAALTRSAEPALIPALLEQARLPKREAAAAQALARRLAAGVRERASASGRAGLVQGLLQEFALSSQEGVALMCLAEALLRIPDAATRDALIRDKIGDADWQQHLGHSPSLFVNAAAWGLLITGKLVATHSAGGLSATLRRAVARGGEPLIRKGVDMAMRLMGEQFVTGESIQQALANARPREAAGFRYSYDMLGEAAMTAADAERYFQAYEQAIEAIGRASAGRGIVDGPGISIKLSALHPRYVRAQAERVHAELYPRLAALAARARRHDIGLNIDAEESERLEISLDLLERLCFEPALADWHGIGFVIQAYQKRCPAVVDFIVDLGRRSGHRLMVRLVKGAYWDSEIKRAQLDGESGYPVYTRKVHTDVAYLACARKLLAAPDAVFPQFATHNAHTLAAIQMMAGDDFEPGRYEFQCLHGMGEPLYEQVVGALAPHGRPCRIYAPVGTHETLLAYLVRRLLENGANTSFVNRIADDDVPLDALIEDPVRTVEATARLEGVTGLPHPKIALPRQLFGAARDNSGGIDLADEATLAGIEQALRDGAGCRWQAAPTTDHDGPWQPVINPVDGAGSRWHAGPPAAGDGAADGGRQPATKPVESAGSRWQARPSAAGDGDAEGARQPETNPVDDAGSRWQARPPAAGDGAADGARQPVTNPADRDDTVGTVREATVDDVSTAVSAAHAAAPGWAATPPADRAARLEAAADRLQADLPRLLPLLLREAGKTRANAVAEVREAVDFLRYYAAEVRRDFDNATHRPLGAVVCISPWNFPLAIFTGQVAAALAAGNVVLAKPAEQTPLVAAAAVRALHGAGVPRDALQLLPGRGETVGAALVADARVHGVLFTGSTDVARLLQRTLAGRLTAHGGVVPLIAETGGQNAMVVDSSALAEQAVADIVASAFDSAGQRCSALRLLCVQEDVADRVIGMLKGAIAECRVGDPRELAVDIGPVIDADARDGIERHVEAMRVRGCPVWRLPLADEVTCRGSFVAPTLIEIAQVADLEREVFGPVLHVLRYRRERLGQLLDHINATGYGLTQGVHTRIDETVAQVVGAAHAGNLYVNRNVVGAVVGVQPFGGEGLSGTGPKAGGPLYLLRLLAERPADAARTAIERSGPAVLAAQLPRALRGESSDREEGAQALAALREWAERHGLAALAASCDGLSDRSPVGAWRSLTGPTGEANLYAVLPRTAVLCLADDGDSGDAARLSQLAAVLAVGARAVWPATARALRDRLPADVRERVSLAQDWTAPSTAIDAALCHGDAATLREVAGRLAERPGPLVLLTGLATADAEVPLERLVIERSLSINTAAAGGNASLMTID